MIKVLIADDETLVRAGIKAVIPWEENGFEVVGEAWDGEDAYCKILSLKPDILITDIKMPKMDGIELLKRLKEEKIPVKSVILSCFDDFDLVREGMKYGAKDYILKLSIDPGQILGVLNEIRKELDDVRQDVFVLHTQDLKYLFVKKLMKKEFESEEQVCNIIKNLRLAVRLEQYRLSRLCLDRKDGASSPKESEMFYNILDQICKRQAGTEIISLGNEEFLIIHNREGKRLHMQIAAAMNSYANRRIFFGSSEPLQNYQNFAEGMSQAEEALECAAFYEAEDEIRYSGLSRERIPPLTYHEEQVLSHALLTGNSGKAVEYVQKLLERIRQCHYPRETCFGFFGDLLNIYGRAAQELNIPVHSLASVETNIYDHIRNQRSLNDCENALRKFTENFTGNIRVLRSSGEREEIFRIKEYVNQHYMENIDLNTAASLVNISASHLSSIFKKETGKNFSAYLTEVRMKEAGRLLKDPHMLIYEVAEKTGYANSGYFGKAFKKYFGITPEEYRKDPRNGEE